MPKSTQTEPGLPRLMRNAAEQIVRSGAALRHAQAALALGKVAEALVVLEAANNGIHLSLPELETLTAAKELELLDDADLADEANLQAAFESYSTQLPDSRYVDKRSRKIA